MKAGGCKTLTVHAELYGVQSDETSYTVCYYDGKSHH